MNARPFSFFSLRTWGPLGLLALPVLAHGQASLTRGLWIGEIQLTAVAEVTVPIDENNNPIGPDPNTPTKTFDKANLRVIMHVNGAGQVSVLKDVAVLSRIAPDANGALALASDFDLALVTDASLLPEFPPQAAKRFASAVFDFGDADAIKAVDAVAFVAAEAAAQYANASVMDLSDAAKRNAEIAAATQAALDAVDDPDRLPATPGSLEDFADTTAGFDNFMRNFLNRAAVTALAGGGAVSPGIAGEAQRLAAGVATNDVLGRPVAFLQDPRASEMITAVSAAITTATAAGTDPVRAAQNAAAGFADLSDRYGRFLAGSSFTIPLPDGKTKSGNLITMITDAAKAGAAAKLAGRDVSDAIKGGASGSPAPARAVIAAKEEALRIQVALYDDTRATTAIAVILDAIVAKAIVTTTTALSALEAELIAAGEQALESAVPRSRPSATNPSPTYSAFIRSGTGFNPTEKYSGAAATAAAAAAAAAITERRNPLGSIDSIRSEAFLAAVDALRFVYRAASRSIRHEQPMEGKLEPGQTVTGTIMLPANHPTNPFRHRRHPDHTTGRDIERRLSFAVDGTVDDPLRRVGFGIDRLTGNYTEEIFGLHKALGPNKNIGLKVAGRFELSRISLIDALNAK